MSAIARHRQLWTPAIRTCRTLLIAQVCQFVGRAALVEWIALAIEAVLKDNTKSVEVRC